MKTLLVLVLPVVAAGVLIGCTTTTNTSRQRDSQLSAKLSSLITNLQDRVTRVNQNFQKVSTQQMKLMKHLGKLDFEQQFELESAAQADHLISDWKSGTLRENFRNGLYTNYLNQCREVDVIEQNFAQSRDAYAASYHDVAVSLKNLQAAKADIDVLSVKPTTQRDAVLLLQILYKAYNSAEAQAKAGAASKTPPPASTP